MDIHLYCTHFLKAESADSLGDTTHTEDTGYFPTKMSHDESPIVAKRKEIKDGSPICKAATIVVLGPQRTKF